jgi:hypothetical protein
MTPPESSAPRSLTPAEFRALRILASTGLHVELRASRRRAGGLPSFASATSRSLVPLELEEDDPEAAGVEADDPEAARVEAGSCRRGLRRPAPCHAWHNRRHTEASVYLMPAKGRVGPMCELVCGFADLRL